jgi:hypothetical protein
VQICLQATQSQAQQKKPYKGGSQKSFGKGRRNFSGRGKGKAKSSNQNWSKGGGGAGGNGRGSQRPRSEGSGNGGNRSRQPGLVRPMLSSRNRY